MSLRYQRPKIFQFLSTLYIVEGVPGKIFITFSQFLERTALCLMLQIQCCAQNYAGIIRQTLKTKQKNSLRVRKTSIPPKSRFQGTLPREDLLGPPASLKRFLETMFTATLLLFSQTKISINKVSPYKRVTSSFLFRECFFFPFFLLLVLLLLM